MRSLLLGLQSLVEHQVPASENLMREVQAKANAIETTAETVSVEQEPAVEFER